MRSQKIQLRLSGRLLVKIDQAASVNFQTRSDFIRETLVRRLKDEALPDLSPNQPEPGQADKLQASIEASLERALKQFPG